MRKSFLLFLVSSLLFVLSSCKSGGTSASLADGDTIPLKYAKNITMVRYGDYVKVDLVNPWVEGGMLASYVLAEGDTPAPDWLGHNILVRTPLKNALVFTAVHCGVMVELGREDAIGGVCERQYIHCLTKDVVDCGNGMSPNQERIIQLHPDAMLVSPFESNTGYDKLGQLGIPIIQCAEYMEPTAIGRAEWIKFYGLLIGREKEAIAQFDAMEAKYDSLSRIARAAGSCPRILAERLYGNVWYQPGVHSAMGQLYADAGAQTAFPQYEQSGSVALSAEQVFAEAHDADVWLIRYNTSDAKDLRSLAAEAPLYSRFDAYQQHHVWGCNVQTTNFYERSPFHPDRLLSDIIQITHPELHLQEPMHYYERLQ